LIKKLVIEKYFVARLQPNHILQEGTTLIRLDIRSATASEYFKPMQNEYDPTANHEEKTQQT
jgi:hypothetical protein